MIALIAVALTVSPAPASPPPTIVAAFGKICLSGDQSMTARLARADADGWQRGSDPRTDRVRHGADGTLTLKVDDTKNVDERLASCGISVATDTFSLVADTTSLLGFPPALDLNTSATYYAVRDGDDWRSGAELDRAASLAAKAQGRFASIVAGSADGSSTLFMIAARPEGVTPPR